MLGIAMTVVLTICWVTVPQVLPDHLPEILGTHCCFLSAIGECRQGEESGLGSLHAEATDNPQCYDAYNVHLATGTHPPECFYGGKMKTVAAPEKDTTS